MTPDFYEKLVSAAEESSADIAAGDVVYYWSEDNQKSNDESWVSYRTFGSGKKFLRTIDDKKEIARSCAVWNKIYRRDLIIKNNLRFYHGKFVEDFPFTFCAVALSDKIALCKDARMYYRQRDTGIMASAGKQNKIIFDAVDNHETLLANFEKLNLLAADKAEWRWILKNFTIDNLLSLSGQLNPDNRQQFFARFADIIRGFDMRNLWWKHIRNYVVHHDSLILKAEYAPNKINYQLFGLSIWKIKNKGNRIKYYLFGIPVMKRKI